MGKAPPKFIAIASYALYQSQESQPIHCRYENPFHKISRGDNKDQTTTALVATIFLKYYLSSLAIPTRVLTDNTPQFTSKRYATLCTKFGVNLITPEYAPKENGRVERSTGTIVLSDHNTTRQNTEKMRSTNDLSHMFAQHKSTLTTIFLTLFPPESLRNPLQFPYQ